MGTPIAIVIAAALLGAAILVVGRWEIMQTPGGIGAVVRLDRWTGSMEICGLDADTLQGNDVKGAQIICRPK